MIKFPTDYGVGELQGNQVATRECYVAIEEHRTATEPVEKLEEVLLDDSDHERTTKIGDSCQSRYPPRAHGFSKKQLRHICLDRRGYAQNRSISHRT